jgi:ABC-type phosphate transport system substrate-binding protein
MTRKLLALSVAATALSIGVAQAQNVTGGGSTLAQPAYTTQYGYYTATNPTTTFAYDGVGSGAGQEAFFENNLSVINAVSGKVQYGTPTAPVDFGASDAFVALGTVSRMDGTSYNIGSNGSYTGFDASGNTTASSAVDGPFIQVPTLGTAITIAFTSPVNPTTKKPYITKLTLTDDQICGIFSGQTTDWNALVSTIPAGTPINLTYRSDSSGTTFLLTNHFYDAGTGGVCNASNDGSSGTGFSTFTGPTQSFKGLFGSNPVPGVASNGSPGVQTYIATTPGAIGYLSPDYTSLNKVSGSTGNAKVLVASVINPNVTSSKYPNGTPEVPTSANTTAGLGAPGSESTNLIPPNTKAAASNPLNWVPSVPTTTKGYSIVGYTTEDFSSCYADPTVGTAITGLLSDEFNTGSATKKYQTAITGIGFALLPANFITAIKADFLTNTSKYNLNIDGSECANFTGR